ncbi:hypothetical protein [Acetobacter thailandicus]|uniref:hypothetical protein n=1 Tax=Acetobacter thailandicus TaxID=1502842 RepID=UPI001BACFD5F|nr:hypothetical protein [Acetobacter thailandicus]MBS0980302.1 hypothetical protein [Acetobacter thailandicus]
MSVSDTISTVLFNLPPYCRGTIRRMLFLPVSVCVPAGKGWFYRPVTWSEGRLLRSV